MKDIKYRFVKMELVEFKRADVEFDKNNGINIQTTFDFGYNQKSNVIRSSVRLEYTQEELILLTCELYSYFELSGDSADELVKDGNITIPNDLLCQLASLGYGSMRGIAYLKNENTGLSDFILPPLFVQNVITEPLVIDLKK